MTKQIKKNKSWLWFRMVRVKITIKFKIAGSIVGMKSILTLSFCSPSDILVSLWTVTPFSEQLVIFTILIKMQLLHSYGQIIACVVFSIGCTLAQWATKIHIIMYQNFLSLHCMCSSAKLQFYLLLSGFWLIAAKSFFSFICAKGISWILNAVLQVSLFHSVQQVIKAGNISPLGLFGVYVGLETFCIPGLGLWGFKFSLF